MSDLAEYLQGVGITPPPKIALPFVADSPQFRLGAVYQVTEGNGVGVSAEMIGKYVTLESLHFYVNPNTGVREVSSVTYRWVESGNEDTIGSTVWKDKMKFIGDLHTPTASRGGPKITVNYKGQLQIFGEIENPPLEKLEDPISDQLKTRVLSQIVQEITMGK